MFDSSKNKSPWWWVPTLYFAEGLPYVAVNVISVIMYKKLGLSNSDIAFFTGWLYLPWVIKPFWSPFVDIIRTKRWWIILMQLVIGVGLGAIAFTLPLHHYIQWSLAIFWIVGFASATHDIAADGYYMIALESSDQSFFVGIRSAFYRCATVFGQGLLVILAGALESRMGNIPKAWSVTFIIFSIFFLLITLYHYFILPRPASDHSSLQGKSNSGLLREFFGTFGSFFKRKDVWIAILFILLYRFPEAQLVKMINPFLLDSREVGGLGLSTSQVGLAYGTVGIIGLTLGGILGGWIASRKGLKKCLWPMALCLTLPCAVFCWMSMAQPDPSNSIHLFLINLCVFFEQFGYGVGFTAFTLYMMYFVQGENRTSHYAICTAFMALGMMLPGMAAGWIQERLGYVNFFWWIMGCCIVTLVVTALVKVDNDYGIKKRTVTYD